jgi:hypothetical protein
MKFVSKDLALKLKEKGFDKPCFGYRYIETPTGFFDGELILNRYSRSGGTYKQTLERHNTIPNIVDAPTIEQVLKWLREEKDIDIVIEPIDRNTIYMGGEKYILAIYFCGKRDYKIHKDNNDKFVKWEDACIYGIEYLMNTNLI